MNSEELKKRTKQFALRVMALVDAMPRTTPGRAIGGQLIRSGTSVGANYRAACRGRSKAEFAAKLGTVAEEADESCFWIELVIEDNLLPAKLVSPLLDEANELTAIFTAAAKTSRLSNQQSKTDIENHEDSGTDPRPPSADPHVGVVVLLGHRPCPGTSGTLHAAIIPETEGVEGTCHCAERHIVEPD